MRLEVWILKQIIEISVFFSFKGDLELIFFLGAKIGDFWPFLKSRVETRCSRLSMLASLDASRLGLHVSTDNGISGLCEKADESYIVSLENANLWA